MFREGQRSSDRFFTVLYCTGGSTEPRLGFAISRQRVRKAVGRNRLRRLVRESFRQVRGALPAVDIVVMAGDAAAQAPHPEIAVSLERHWGRLQRLSSPGNSAPTPPKD